MSVWRSRDAPRGRVRSTVSLLRGGGGFLFRHIRTIRNYVLWRANIKTLPCFWSDWRQMSISVVSHASYLPYPKVGLKLNIRRSGERERGGSRVGDLQQMENEIDSAKCFMCARWADTVCVSGERRVLVVVVVVACVRSLCKDKVWAMLYVL